MIRKFFLLFIALSLSSCGTEDNNTKTIAIVSIVEIEPIKQLRDGFREALNESKKPFQIEEFNAQGDSAIINQIVDQIITSKPDLVYVLGTPISQAIQKRDESILVVQGAVTDPVAAGLADTWEKTGKNYAGNSDLPPIPLQLKLISDVLPNTKRLGVVYNPGETNSVAIIERLRAELAKGDYGFELVERPIAKSADIVGTIESLIGNADALYVPPDNTLHSGIRSVINTSSKNGIPVFATTSESVEFGALAAIALDFEELGREAGMLALRIIGGEINAEDTSIMLSENPSLIVNKEAAISFQAELKPLDGYKNVVVR